MVSDGTPNDWIRCPYCGSEDAYYIDWRPDNDLTLKCPDCEQAEHSGAYWHGSPENEAYYHEL